MEEKLEKKQAPEGKKKLTVLHSFGVENLHENFVIRIPTSFQITNHLTRCQSCSSREFM